MLDLLFSEQDRHGQNVFVDEDYNMMVIDNEGAYGPLNSMFIPGTQKVRLLRLSCLVCWCSPILRGAEVLCNEALLHKRGKVRFLHVGVSACSEW